MIRYPFPLLHSGGEVMLSRSKCNRLGSGADEEEEGIVAVSSDPDEEESDAERGTEADDGDDDDYVGESSDAGEVDEAEEEGAGDNGDGGRRVRGGRRGGDRSGEEIAERGCPRQVYQRQMSKEGPQQVIQQEQADNKRSEIHENLKCDRCNKNDYMLLDGNGFDSASTQHNKVLTSGGQDYIDIGGFGQISGRVQKMNSSNQQPYSDWTTF